MRDDATDWVAEKLTTGEQVEILERTAEGFLVVESKEHYAFPVAVLGVQNVIMQSDVEPLFAGASRPKFIVNVPSKTLWSGEAICYVHAASAAFGTLGDVSRAASTGDAGSYRDRNMGFFINAMKQHSNVSGVSYIYDRVFKVDRRTGKDLTVAVIDAYNMSAEDVRNARGLLGHFDIVVKSSSHGTITHPADAAAKSMGAEALTFGDLLRRLAK